eukprot:6204006-Pleurochrysis_carterae.AAC.2
MCGGSSLVNAAGWAHESGRSRAAVKRATYSTLPCSTHLHKRPIRRRWQPAHVACPSPPVPPAPIRTRLYRQQRHSPPYRQCRYVPTCTANVDTCPAVPSRLIGTRLSRPSSSAPEAKLDLEPLLVEVLRVVERDVLCDAEGVAQAGDGARVENLEVDGH